MKTFILYISIFGLITAPTASVVEMASKQFKEKIDNYNKSLKNPRKLIKKIKNDIWRLFFIDILKKNKGILLPKFYSQIINNKQFFLTKNQKALILFNEEMAKNGEIQINKMIINLFNYKDPKNLMIDIEKASKTKISWSNPLINSAHALTGVEMAVVGVAVAGAVGGGIYLTTKKSSPDKSNEPKVQNKHLKVKGHAITQLKALDHPSGEFNNYAPSIIYFNNEYHVFWCGAGHFDEKKSWDQVYYSRSKNGSTWTEPILMLSNSQIQSERAACDPSVFFDEKRQHFYMFYSGNPVNIGTTIFMARATTITGPYAKLSVNNKWIDHGQNPVPKPLVYPAHHVADENWYGAGQSSVVRLNGKTYHWYSDQNLYYPKKQEYTVLVKIHEDSEMQNVPSKKTNVKSTSIDVKWDPKNQHFVMFDIRLPHKKGSYLVMRTSKDGIKWSGEKVLCDANCMPDNAHNIGAEGNEFGHLRSKNVLIGYGAAKDLNPSAKYADGGSEWGRWMLTMHLLDL